MNQLPKFLSVEDVNKLIESALTPKNQLMIRTMFVLGLRVSEMTSIKLWNVNFIQESVMITGKGNKQRLLPVPRYLLTDWEQHIQKRKPKVYLFENAFNEPYDTRRVRQIVYDAANKAGIEHTWPHKLRHSRATQLLNDNLPLASLQRFLGHSHLNTTAIYTHLAIEPLRKFL